MFHSLALLTSRPTMPAGIEVVKCSAWEAPLRQRIDAARELELGKLWEVCGCVWLWRVHTCCRLWASGLWACGHSVLTRCSCIIYTITSRVCVKVQQHEWWPSPSPRWLQVGVLQAVMLFVLYAVPTIVPGGGGDDGDVSALHAYCSESTGAAWRGAWGPQASGTTTLPPSLPYYFLLNADQNEMSAR